MDDPRLQDGMQQRWPADAVAEHVAAAVQRLRPSRVSGRHGVTAVPHPCATRSHSGERNGNSLNQVFHLGSWENKKNTVDLSSCCCCLWGAAAQLYPLQRLGNCNAMQVYTFDAGGVSGHPNHLAVCAGVLRWWAAAPSSSSATSLPQLWQLESVGLLRKYAAVLDAPLAWAITALRQQLRGRSQAAWHACWQPRRAQRALLAHSSQMVW